MDSVRRLVDIRDEDSYLLASFFVTDETALRKLVEQWSRRDKDHKSFHGRTKDQTESVSSTTFGGSVALLDPSQLSAGLIRECPSPVATGLAFAAAMKSAESSQKRIAVICPDLGYRYLSTLFNPDYSRDHSLPSLTKSSLASGSLNAIIDDLSVDGFPYFV